jgi:hypothetical protein
LTAVSIGFTPLDMDNEELARRDTLLAVHEVLMDQQVLDLALFIDSLLKKDFSRTSQDDYYYVLDVLAVVNQQYGDDAEYRGKKIGDICG